jgi:putative membrane protein (TIGR04086 family)
VAIGAGRVHVERRAVLAGALAGFVVAAASILLWQLCDAVFDLGDSSLVFAFYVVVLVGWIAAGYVAGRRSPDAPYSHGVLASVVSFAPIAVVGLVIAAARGDDIPAVEMTFNLLVAGSAGILGGLLAGARP